MAIFFMFLASIFEVFQIGLAMPMVDIVFNKKKIVVPNQLPDFLAQYVDKLNNMDPNRLFWFFPFILIGGIFLKQFFTFCHGYVMSDVSQRILRDVRGKLYHQLQNLSLDYFSEKRTGELISRITHDVQLIENSISYGLTDLFKQSFMIVMFIATAFTIFPKGAIVIFTIFPLISLPMASIGKRLRKLANNYQSKMADINSLLLETITGIKLVKVFCMEDYESKRFNIENQSYYKLKMKSIKRTLVISPITEIFGAVCGAVVFLWIGKSVVDGEISFGVFILFFGSIMSIISPVKKLGNVNALVQQALSANERIYEVLDSQPSVKEKVNPLFIKEMRGSIKICGVDFSYSQATGIVLKDINLEIKKGEIVAIVGPTGSGKTTLINLIPRLYDPVKGVIKVDGTDLRGVSFKSLRDQIGIVTQETILFNDTVKANISYGQLSADIKDIKQAAKNAYADQFIEKMPHGYDTVIGERGFRLSGGEKQRISIARALLRNPPILLLDEATSALDSQSEKFVQGALDVLMKDRTVIAIAHRLSTVKKADKIVVLEGGRIVGLGKHDALIENCSLYKRLHDMQFQL